MDADLAIPKPKNITIEQAATLGVGIEVSASLDSAMFYMPCFLGLEPMAD